MPHFDTGRIPGYQNHYDYHTAPQQTEHRSPLDNGGVWPNPLLRGLMRALQPILAFQSRISLGNLQYARSLCQPHLDEPSAPVEQRPNRPSRAATTRMPGARPGTPHDDGVESDAGVRPPPGTPEPDFEAHLHDTSIGVRDTMQAFAREIEHALRRLQEGLQAVEARPQPGTGPVRNEGDSLRRQFAQGAGDASEPEHEDSTAHALSLVGAAPGRRRHAQAEAGASDTDSEALHEDQDEGDRDSDISSRERSGRSAPFIPEQHPREPSAQPQHGAGTDEAVRNAYAADSSANELANAKTQTSIMKEGRDHASFLTR